MAAAAATAARGGGLVVPRPVTFVTGNAKKLEEVRTILGNSIPFQSLKCQNCKASLKKSPKRKLDWLLLSYAEMPREEKNKISHHYRALARALVKAHFAEAGYTFLTDSSSQE